MNDAVLIHGDTQLVELLETQQTYIEWGLPNYVGHKWVYWDTNAGVENTEDEDNNCMVRVPVDRWKAGRCIQSRDLHLAAKNEEERFEDLRSALLWLKGPLPKGAR
jgi:hypothetical protein